MARFVIEYAPEIEKRRQTSFLAKRTGFVRDGDRLGIGTRSTSGLPLDDPLVKEDHCVITWREGGFVLEDRDTTLGTYLNGLPVTAAMPLGAQGEIVLGVSRLRYKADPATQTLTLSVDDQGFHYKTFKSDLSKFDPKDPDAYDPRDEYDSVRWTKSETTFGRLPALLFLNLLAAAVVVVMVPLALLRPTREPWFDPGPLAAKHLAVMGPGGSKKDGCATCHDSFGGTPPARCGQAGCHQTLLVDFHPRDKDWPAKKSCTACHWDHQGTGLDQAVAPDPVPGFVPASTRTPDSCRSCHGEKTPALTRERPQQAWALVKGRFGFSTFSHDNHVHPKADPKTGKTAAPVPCAECHALRPGTVAQDLAAGFPARSFDAVSFETCMKCHGKDSTHPLAPQQPELRVAVTWHGSDDQGKCLQCHATRSKTSPADLAVSAGLRQAPVSEGIPGYDFRTRSHEEQREQHKASPPCEQCHLDRAVGGWNERKGVPFPHHTHLTRQIPRNDEERKSINAQCAACHREQAESSALSSPVYPGPSDPVGKTDVCAECHQGEAANRPKFVAPPREPTRSRNDFPHALHLKSQHPTLAHGCLACHFSTSDAGPLAARPQTLPQAADCTLCHQRHESVGGGSCAVCHKPGDRVWFGPDAGFLRSWPVEGDMTAFRPVFVPPGPLLRGQATDIPVLEGRATRFSHRSQGHERVLGKCELCHATAGNAPTVEQVPIPGEADDACRKCHVEQRARFHWR